MPVPFFDHKPVHEAVRDELMAAFHAVLSGDALILGEQVRNLRRNSAVTSHVRMLWE